MRNMLYLYYDNRNISQRQGKNTTMAEQSEVLMEALRDLYQRYKYQFVKKAPMPGSARLGPVEDQIFGMLEGTHQTPVKEVVKILGLPNSTVTSAVDRLMKKKILTKEVMASDRRAYVLTLTKSGEAIAAYNRYLQQQFAESLLESLSSDQDRLQFIDMLDQILKGLALEDQGRNRSEDMDALRKEYNGFGPWLLPVGSEEAIPQQFMAYKDKILDGDYSFKVPIKEERRKLRPGMLMYNSLLSIHKDSLLILRITDEGLEADDVTYEEIRCLTISKDLLDSHIVIWTDAKTYDIDYNSVSEDVSDKATAMLRERIFVEESTKADLSMDLDLIDNKRIQALKGHLAKDEDLTLLAYQPGTGVEKIYNTMAESFLYSFRRYDLQDMAVFRGPKELVIANSLKEVKMTREADYSYRYVFIKSNDIKAITMTQDPTGEHLMNLILEVGEARPSFKVTDTFDRTVLLHYIGLK